MVQALDYSGREPSLSFVWVIFSPTRVEIPPANVTVLGKVVDVRLLDAMVPGTLAKAVSQVQSEMKGRTISKTLAAWLATWQKDGNEFQATLIRAPEGDYLTIMRGDAGWSPLAK